jgi:two-component system, cell cycle sensor histidine kinase and response regulator CckA
VLMNLFVNARDAMPNGGAITVATQNVSLSMDQAKAMPEGREGDFVRVTVADNGAGMSQETMARVFEPFFTTKEAGKGTGLGLATSFGIVQQHGGWILIHSQLDVGTSFQIYLPRFAGEMALEVTPPPQVMGPILGGRETILLVDDEAVVRGVAEGTLRKHGYHIITAADGEEALSILGRMDGAIDLVVLDLTMPRLSGRETFAAMRRGNARTIPVIICSGYLLDIDTFAAETGARPDAIIQKPYALETFAGTVRTVLDEAKAAAPTTSPS